MRYRRVPRTDISVSEVGLPVNDLIDPQRRSLDQAGAERLLHRAVELGITFFSVPDFPDQGEGETLLATAFARRRHEIVIAATGGYDWYAPPHLRKRGVIDQVWTPEFIRKACEASLKRLHTDYIDLYLLHHPGMRAMESEELFDALATLRREGKMRQYGIVLGPGLNWDEEGEMALKERKVVCVHAIVNVLEQKPTRQLFPLAKTYESGIIAANPLAVGVLDGSETSHDPRLRELQFLRRNYDSTLAQAAIKFALADPSIVATLPSVTKEDRLAELASASDLPPMAAEDLQQLRDLYDAGFGLKGRIS